MSVISRKSQKVCHCQEQGGRYGRARVEVCDLLLKLSFKGVFFVCFFKVGYSERVLPTFENFYLASLKVKNIISQGYRDNKGRD